MDIKCFAERVHITAMAKGWWDESVYRKGRIAEALLNIHSEVTEASEAAREERYDYYNHDGKPEGMVVELADTIIRILDLCEALELDIEEALAAKAAYNERRPYRHGGKAY